MPSDKRICAACVLDEYLKAEIAKSPTVDQKCDYCGTVRPTIEMWSLAERCDSVINDFYDCNPGGNDLAGVLDQLVGPPQQAVNDLVELFSDMWFDNSSHEHLYGEDPCFIEKTKFSEPLSDAWDDMERSIKQEARYVNPRVTIMLESVFGTVLDDLTCEGKAVVVELGLDREIDTLYRGRVFQTVAAMETALSHPERHIGPPPSGIGAAGRMNAKGVSVFYGATKKDIAISEVRPPVGSYVVLGAFKLTRTLRLLDLQQLGSITLKPTSSPFDPITAKEASRRDFLKTLTRMMVMPVMPELEDQGYLITQAIADFLSTHPKLELDGILFSSAQNTMTSRDKSGRNVVLFNKASTVLNAEDFNFSGDTQVDLWAYDECFRDLGFKPEIKTKEPPKDEENCDMFMWLGTEPIKPALKLDRNAIEIYEVNGVEYQTCCHQVEQHIVEPKKTTRG